MAALCPYCNSMLSYLRLEEITSSAFMGTQWRTIAYVCPSCQKAITVSIDPIALMHDIINSIKDNKV
jgi:DNA-directed RNA polymerase subunit RPC12/RpoP